MPDIVLRPGRKPPHPDTHEYPRLKLRHFLATGALPAVPPVVDWVSGVTDWPMYGNDNWGDCVPAMIGHAIEASTRYGQGTTVEPTDQDILDAYSAITGFDPNAGPPGDNPTDQGTVIQDALNYWRKTGIAGHKLTAFAQVDHENMDEVQAALYLFGHLLVGINCPDSAIEQFNAGQEWDVVRGSRIDGGHAITIGFVRNDKGAIEWDPVTWGKRWKMTKAFFGKYVEEAWIGITPEWINAAGNNPEGINVSALGAAFHELTGDPSPFPINPPAPPAPGPQPPIPPAGHDPHDLELDKALAQMNEAWQTWRSAKDLP